MEHGGMGQACLVAACSPATFKPGSSVGKDWPCSPEEGLLVDEHLRGACWSPSRLPNPSLGPDLCSSPQFSAQPTEPEIRSRGGAGRPGCCHHGDFRAFTSCSSLGSPERTEPSELGWEPQQSPFAARSGTAFCKPGKLGCSGTAGYLPRASIWSPWCMYPLSHEWGHSLR